MSVVKDAETGQRGYLLTGNESYLEPFVSADASISNVTKQLRDLTADDPVQARRIEQALLLVQAKMGSSSRRSICGIPRGSMRPSKWS